MPSPTRTRAATRPFRDRLEAGWRAGNPPPIEALVGDAPADARPDVFRDLLLIEAAERERAGRPMTAGEARSRYAGLDSWAAGVVDEMMAEQPVVRVAVVDGPQAGKTFVFRGHAVVLVGRGPGVTIDLAPDGGVSRSHCLIEVNPPVARLVRISSRRTRLNGRDADDVPLTDDDLIQVGDSALRVRLPGGSGATPATARPPGLDELRERVRTTLAEAIGYRVEGEIGHGLMGAVYRGRSLSDGSAVAVKFVLTTVGMEAATAAARFCREVDLLRRLDHPNVVTYRDSGTAGPLLYVVTDLVPGSDADALAGADLSGRVAPDRVLGWAAQLLDALAYAHDRGVVHRDVKPTNLLIEPAPGGEVVRLADFGLSKAYQSSTLSGLTGAGAAGGTPAFLPPEQVTDFRSAGPAADQYAAAATLYKLLTGHHVYERQASVPELLRLVLEREPIPLRGHGEKGDFDPADFPAGVGAAPVAAVALPGRFDRVVKRALARDPADRYPDVRAMKADLLG